MARHGDDMLEVQDLNLATGEMTHTFLLQVETDCTPAEREGLRTAAVTGAGALDAWYASLPSSDERRTWWAGLDGSIRNKWRAGFKFGHNA